MRSMTVLGPVGATFSSDACDWLMKRYRIHRPINMIDVGSNGEILPSVSEHGRRGYGVVAMDTLAEGRVTEPLESFIDLLRLYPKKDTPFHVVGAVQMKLSFCLMARPGTALKSVRCIIAHPKSFGACNRWIESRGYSTVAVASNGEAAKTVAKTRGTSVAALGPISAAKKYGLEVLAEGCEDRQAITTFFLLGPRSRKIAVGERNRLLIVFSVPHKPGALSRALRPFEREGLNLIQIHSVHAGNHTYHFAIELEVGKRKKTAVARALKDFRKVSTSFIPFGPFPVLSG